MHAWIRDALLSLVSKCLIESPRYGCYGREEIKEGRLKGERR